MICNYLLKHKSLERVQYIVLKVPAEHMAAHGRLS